MRDVSIAFGKPPGVEVVTSASFAVHGREIVGLVGESGAGKTVTGLAALGLLDVIGGQLTGGSIHLQGRDVTNLDTEGWRRLRGRDVAMIFQQPMRSLNPSLTVGEQVAETVRQHRGAARRAAWERAVDLLAQVHIDRPRDRAREYPHQLSGGMAQRAMIAMALASDPALIVADEPTTALDTRIQRTIMELLRTLVDETGVSVLYISHDLALVGEFCTQAHVMYAGQVVESGGTREMFQRPLHPYTAGLLESVPDIRDPRPLGLIPGVVPSPESMPHGCRFNPRCPFAIDEVCTMGSIELESVGDTGRYSRCVRVGELLAGGHL